MLYADGSRKQSIHRACSQSSPTSTPILQRRVIASRSFAIVIKVNPHPAETGRCLAPLDLGGSFNPPLHDRHQNRALEGCSYGPVQAHDQHQPPSSSDE